MLWSAVSTISLYEACCVTQCTAVAQFTAHFLQHRGPWCLHATFTFKRMWDIFGFMEILRKILEIRPKKTSIMLHAAQDIYFLYTMSRRVFPQIGCMMKINHERCDLCKGRNPSFLLAKNRRRISCQLLNAENVMGTFPPLLQIT